MSESPPPSSSSNPTPSSGDNSPPPPSDNSPPPPPPPDNNSNNSSSSNNNAPPPSNNNNNSPSPPPPPTPPPSNNNNNSPSSSNSSAPPPANNNNNNNNNGNKSPPPPPPKSSSSSGSSTYPPPPPPPGLSPSHQSSEALSPPKHGSSSKKFPEGSSSTGQSTAIIAGVVAGAGLLLLLMIVLVAACCKRKKRKPHDQMGYYRDNSNGIRNGYYNSGPQGNWRNNMQSADHTVKMPPSTQVSSEHGWPIAPPPPPPMMSSSEMSSAAFSGPHNPPLPPPHPAVALGFNQSSFTYDDLAAATGGFSRSNLLGQGGFGFVHKGVLPNGKEIAVKSLKANSGQGEREFQAEVDIISRVHHRHLVSLVGYCIAGPQRMLVYEFVPNHTLEFHLHGSGRPVMDFPTRHKIALGSAKGFAYLHEDCHPRIIHRDIKAANILIDDNFEAKVADFGLAKLASDNNTHVSTRIMGTFGYLAPEYASSGKLTEKSDVYSFGVVLLELITGKKPVDVSSEDDSLVDWARPILLKAADGGGFEELVDPRLENNYDYQGMLAMVACAGASIRHSARRRPKMSQIVRALEGDVSLEDLTEGMKLGNNGIFGSSGSSEYDSTYHREKMKKAGMSSQEFSSSEYGMTGEYAHSGGESQEMRPNATRGRGHTP